MPRADIASIRIAKKLSPIQAGARRLSAQYGEQLVCVRYRIDDEKKKRYTTIELVVEARPVQTTSKTVGIRIAYGETDLRTKIKAAGGQWDPEAKLWRLPKRKPTALGLSKRIVHEPN